MYSEGHHSVPFPRSSRAPARHGGGLHRAPPAPCHRAATRARRAPRWTVQQTFQTEAPEGPHLLPTGPRCGPAGRSGEGRRTYLHRTTTWMFFPFSSFLAPQPPPWKPKEAMAGHGTKPAGGGRESGEAPTPAAPGLGSTDRHSPQPPPPPRAPPPTLNHARPSSLQPINGNARGAPRDGLSNAGGDAKGAAEAAAPRRSPSAAHCMLGAVMPGCHGGAGGTAMETYPDGWRDGRGRQIPRSGQRICLTAS